MVAKDTVARNLELKVGCDTIGLAQVRERLRAAEIPLLVLAQVDTYFAVPNGRLKLREMVPATEGAATAELIAYARPNSAGPRWSTYHRVPVTIGDAPLLRAALAATVGVLVEVMKTRTVGMWGRTRVHLDEVRGLGSFVELETVLTGADDAGADEELAEMATLLGLDQLPSIPGSYSDLLLATQHAMTDTVTKTNAVGQLVNDDDHGLEGQG